MNRWMPKLSSLSAQMILSSIALVLLTAAAAGLPALWLIRSQLHRQALSQVEQGSRAAQALYEARQNELASLATLTAQRPTLHQLLIQKDHDELSAYLHTLQQSLGLDLVLICGAGEKVATQAGETTLTGLCKQEDLAGFHVVPAEAAPQVWLFSGQVLVVEADTLPYTVFLGQHLDDEFAMQMRDQTGLEHTLLVNRLPVASSLPARQLLPSSNLDDAPQDIMNVDGHPYYFTRFPLGAVGIQSEVALEITDIAGTQRQLAWSLFGSILVVAVVASLVGTFSARRIGSPLAHLAEAASAMSRGDLDIPMKVEARVREVALVAQALEGARADLKRTLAELRQEKAWIDHLLESIVEGIVTLDRQGRITFFSHGAEQITGWRRDEVLDRSCDQVFHPIETERSFSQLIPAPGRRQKISVELRDGRHAILAVTGGRLLPPARGDDRVALVFRDVSEEEALHRLLGHFLANVAHEFRTPLSALAASVELLLDQAPDLSSAELEELLTSLHLGVLSLQTLIDNLLEGASIEIGHFRVHPRPSNLGGIIAEAISTMQPLLDKHDQRLVVELPVAIPMVRADPRRTVQVLTNLLSNASKYGPDDAEIEVSAVVRGHWARVTVADCGPGVPPEQQKNLFRRFVYPSPANDRAQVGVGLGLSVVKAIVEGHGGEVGVDQRKGGGSAFWFTLPLVGTTQTEEDKI
jgi:PAS domain S-box-containing protein